MIYPRKSENFVRKGTHMHKTEHEREMDAVGMVALFFGVVIGMLVMLFLTTAFATNTLTEPLPAQVWVDPAYCTQADHGLLCDIDPHAHEEP